MKSRMRRWAPALLRRTLCYAVGKHVADRQQGACLGGGGSQQVLFDAGFLNPLSMNFKLNDAPSSSHSLCLLCLLAWVVEAASRSLLSAESESSWQQPLSARRAIDLGPAARVREYPGVWH